MNIERLNLDFEKLGNNFPQELEGQWIAVLDGKIIAHNFNFKELFQIITEKGLSKEVLFHKIPKKETIII